MIHVVLAEDHHLVRQGIHALLDRSGDIQVIGEAHDGQQAVNLVESLKPDVLVIDISMPRLSGIQAAEQLRLQKASARIVVLSVHSDPLVVRSALRSGVMGYVLKQAVADELLMAVRSAYQRKTYLSRAISSDTLTDYLESESDPETSPLEQLSPREREVLKLVVEGSSSTQIAVVLNISLKTVEKHRASLMTKLGVHDVTGLVRLAIKYKLVFLDD